MNRSARGSRVTWAPRPGRAITAAVLSRCIQRGCRQRALIQSDPKDVPVDVACAQPASSPQMRSRSQAITDHDGKYCCSHHVRLPPFAEKEGREGGRQAVHPEGASAMFTLQSCSLPDIISHRKPKEPAGECETTDSCATFPLVNSTTFPCFPEAVKLHKLARKSPGLP